MNTKTWIVTLLLLCSGVAQAMPLGERLPLNSLLQLGGEVGPQAATVELLTQGNAFIVELEVRSPNAYYAANAVMSDHVEIWLAHSPHPKLDYPGKFYTSNFTDALYWFEHPDQANAVPGAENSAYSGLPQTCHNRDPASFTFQPKRTHLGMVHFGINPWDGSVVAYDEAYQNGLRVEPLAWQVQVENLTVTSSGYSLTVRIPTEAFGLVPRAGLDQFRLMVDVIGSDGERQHTVLSTSADRKWGEPSTFGVVSLPEPLTPSLPAELDFAGVPAATLPPGRRALHERLWPYLVWTGERWEQGYLGKMDSNRLGDDLCTWGLGSDNAKHELNLIAEPLRYSSHTVNGQRIEKLGPHVFLDGQWLMRVPNQYFTVFGMPGGETAMLHVRTEYAGSRFSTGPCAAGRSYHLELSIVTHEGALVQAPVFSHHDCLNRMTVGTEDILWHGNDKPHLIADEWVLSDARQPKLVQEDDAGMYQLTLGFDGKDVSVQYSLVPRASKPCQKDPSARGCEHAGEEPPPVLDLYKLAAPLKKGDVTHAEVVDKVRAFLAEHGEAAEIETRNFCTFAGLRIRAALSELLALPEECFVVTPVGASDVFWEKASPAQNIVWLDQIVGPRERPTQEKQHLKAAVEILTEASEAAEEGDVHMHQVLRSYSEWLLDHHGPVEWDAPREITSNWATPLYSVLWRGRQEELRVVFDHAVDAASRQRMVDHALSYYARKGRVEDLRALLKVYSPSTQGGVDALILAAGNPELLAPLENAGFGVHTQLEDGSYPIHVAAGLRTVPVAKLEALLEMGAVQEKADDRSFMESLAAYLVEQAPTANTPNGAGKVPLVQLIDLGIHYQGDRERILEGTRLLLAHGADANVTNSRGETPLHRMIFQEGKYSNDEAGVFLEPFLKPGAPVNRKDSEGRTPLTLVFNYGLAEFVEPLVELGADANEVDGDGRTFVMKALEYGDVELARAFGAAGTNTALKDAQGRDACYYVGESIRQYPGMFHQATQWLGCAPEEVARTPIWDVSAGDCLLDRVVFQSERAGSTSLYSLPGWSRGATPLHDEAGKPVQGERPRVMPGGAGVVFERDDDVYLWQCGGKVKRLAPQGDFPSWVSDGESLLMRSYIGGRTVRLFRDGSRQVIGGGVHSHVEPMPGKELATVGYSSRRLPLHSLHGGSRGTLAEIESAQSLEARFSPYGDALAIKVSPDRESTHIMVHDLQGHEARVVSEPGYKDSSPTWSEDGRYVVYASERDEGTSLFRVNLASGDIERITDDAGSDGEPDWGWEIIPVNAPYVPRLGKAGYDASGHSVDQGIGCYVSEAEGRKRLLFLEGWLTVDGENVYVEHESGAYPGGPGKRSTQYYANSNTEVMLDLHQPGKCVGRDKCYSVQLEGTMRVRKDGAEVVKDVRVNCAD